MLSRRLLLAAAASAAVPAMAGAADSFAAFLNGVRADARRQGISQTTLDRALTGLRPNQKVIELDHYQPEFTMTWQHYRETRVSDTRVANGRAAYTQNRATLQAVSARFGVSPAVIVGVWGLETNYGTFLGGFNVIEALATLAWEGRRASYFRTELIAALKILDHGDVSFARMLGSYAGAMGQPQFMPSNFDKLAVDFEGNGRRDIWDSKPDALASIANYLARSGWRAGEGWGEQVRVPPGLDLSLAGRDNRRSLGEWARLGVARFDGRALPRTEAQAGLVLPDGAGGESFLVYGNFAAIRRYNPSDYYALSVGLLGDLVAA